MGILVSKKLYQPRKGHLAYWCPGCEALHILPIRGEVNADHTWNVSTDKEIPTFDPSIDVKIGHYTGRLLQPPHCDTCNDAINGRYKSECLHCHSWVRNGRIEFLNDCTHDLANKTVDLPDLPEHIVNSVTE